MRHLKHVHSIINEATLQGFFVLSSFVALLSYCISKSWGVTKFQTVHVSVCATSEFFRSFHFILSKILFVVVFTGLRQDLDVEQQILTVCMGFLLRVWKKLDASSLTSRSVFRARVYGVAPRMVLCVSSLFVLFFLCERLTWRNRHTIFHIESDFTRLLDYPFPRISNSLRVK